MGDMGYWSVRRGMRRSQIEIGGSYMHLDFKVVVQVLGFVFGKADILVRAANPTPRGVDFTVYARELEPIEDLACVSVRQGMRRRKVRKGGTYMHVDLKVPVKVLGFVFGKALIRVATPSGTLEVLAHDLEPLEGGDHIR